MRLAASLSALTLVSACTAVETASAPAPTSAFEALQAYYDTIPTSSLPRAPDGPALPGADDVVTTILVGSCNDEEKPSPALATIAGLEADLFLMVGDNVYGDRDGRAYTNNDADLNELKESFSDLAADPGFQAVRAATPMMVAWDDHDYGANDAGREFPFKGLAERMHETFWHLDDEDVGAWPGTYYARSFGPDGQRVQVIMLDTRYFRSPLTPTDEWGAKGKERYMPAVPGSEQDLLGAEQWTWLENQLQEPADLRLVVSSIQVLTSDGHGWEHWNNLPHERQHLFDLVDDTDANGVVFVSGDRHASFLYRSTDSVSYPVHEITASSINASFFDETEEIDSAQIGSGYSLTNFGAININWDSRQVDLSIHSETGEMVRRTRFAIPD
ncbi:MAG: alkaline phosphatase D family protein [Pseudomonadota bacterium]